MGPLRQSKRARTKPPIEQAGSRPNVESNEAPSEAGSSTSAESSTPVPKTPQNAANSTEDIAVPLTAGNARSSANKPLKSKSSWYGTWPRKSTASTQVARETILADKPTNTSSADLGRFETKPPPATSSRPPSMLLGKSKETLDVTMGGTYEAENAADNIEHMKPMSSENEADAPSPLPVPTENIPAPPRTEPVSDAASQRPSTSSGWLGGWLSRPMPQTHAADECQQITSQPQAAQKPQDQMEQEAPNEQPVLKECTTENASASVPTPAPPSSSWFGLWSTAAPSTVAEAPKDEIPVKTGDTGGDTVMEDAPSAVPEASTQPAAGSSWAFWSTDSKKPADAPAKTETSGQLAVAGESSQDKPEPAKTVPVKDTQKKDSKKGKSSKRTRPLSGEVEELQPNSSVEAAPKATSSQSPASVKATPPNLLLPSVKSTYRLVENPSILQQITRLIMYGQQQPVKHVFLVKDPPKIKKALAIGIHGLFPAPLLRTVIGQPTGTSIRFANHAASAIRRWTDKHGSVDCEIEKVALEGEGKIADRVDNLWKLLLNWIDHVRKADFILVACHSQGVPVALMLVAKLVEFGVVTTGKIGVCAMAGVSLGPFPDYKSRLFSGSAGELFEFADPESTVSKRYEDSLRVAVKYGVKITYCGSIDDQLVSMESSTFSPASHPYIYRAVFVDGRIHAPDFLSHLVGFALKLRNLGVSDHGLIRELSAPLAGSLYTGEGHSRLYDDGNVYDLAIEYALETTTVGDVPLDVKKYEIPTNANPYILPWIMRGLLEEDFVKTELDQETTELLKKFDDWKPATKVLKDVKYRLEAVRSKL
ncbi:uncharacterized protein LY89DRAFT_638452 [Mollisia scopiformis]|uniref:YMC020W-like alpha/beta hydrolase domain-containing protein n=1 Tax=Mollisia scopiformis TaxID=149040 RepID=A0A194XPT4_MOLSC|nr:uncharacterized protein LY89DRAFT_638452 [Mollisia scopiformis]KUJ22203.1 hypothetical protein LY89DRAFT_638452 [Mollisia scopiformis]